MHHPGSFRLARTQLPVLAVLALPGDEDELVFLLIAHLELTEPDAQLARAAEPIGLLAAQPDTRSLRWARSTEEADRFVLVAEFDSAAACRRALSPFEVRTVVIPWLSRAEVTSSGVFEVLTAADEQQLRHPEVTVPEPGR